MVKYSLSFLFLIIQFSTTFAFFSNPNNDGSQSTIYEVENHFSVVNDVGSKGDIVEFPQSIYADGTGKAVTLFDKGDKLKIGFEVETQGPVQIKVRLRSGYNNAPQSYWPNGYAFTLDGNPIELVGDINSISTFQSSFGGTYWGTMVLNDVELSAGSHEITIECKSNWGAVDYLELVQDVITNEKPGIEPIADQENFIGVPISLQVIAVDSEGDNLAYEANGLPEGLSIDNESGLISGEIITDRANSLYPIFQIVTIKVYETENPNNFSEAKMKWTVLVYDSPALAKYEVEEWFSINQDFSGNGPIEVFKGSSDNGTIQEVVGLPDKNDQIHINFSIPEDGFYKLTTRIRSGDGNDSLSLWSSGYSFFVDDVRLDFTGDSQSIFKVNDAFGESYWGDLKSPVLDLKKGNYFLEIRADKAMGGIDFFEVEIAEGVSSSLYQNQALQGLPNSVNIYFAKWLDFDNDGDLDLMTLEEGENSNQIKLYTNDLGNFISSLVPLPFTEGYLISSFEVRDFDSDGDFDFLLYTFDGSNTGLRIIQNEEGNYSEITPRMHVQGVYNFKWIDLDQDGDLELSIRENHIQDSRDMVMELDEENKVLFENYERNTAGVGSYADYNQDGLVDFLYHGEKLSESSIFTYWTKILKQNSSGVFEDINAGLPDQLYGEWFDYNGDGLHDIKAATYYLNNGNGQFSDTGIPSPKYPNNSLNGLTNVIDRVDFNGDGYMDLFTSDGKLFINQSSFSKPIPIVPTNLNASVDSNSVLLTWDNVRKTEENEVYNLYVKKGDELVLTGEANLLTGYALVNQSNVGIHPIFKVTNLKPGTYQWSVQTKGTGQLSSVFAAEGSFTIENEIEEEVNQLYEAEEHYVVENDFGSKSAVMEFSSPVYSDGSGSAVAIFDKGDGFKIDFDIPSSGNYKLQLRVRSGHSQNSKAYWPNGYLYQLDNNEITLIGDNNSISDLSNYYGGAYWGDMIAESVPISEGNHSLSITANSHWGAIDYLIIEKVNGTSSSRIAKNGLLTTKASGLEEISLYPNPTQNILNISYSSEALGKYDIKVLDLTGKEMYSTILEKQEKTHIASFDISQFKPGVYLMVISNNESKIIRKFLKK